MGGAAKLEDIIAAAIKVSDFILIPIQPSTYDIWAASDLVELIKARQEVTDGQPQAAFIITRRIEGTKLGGDVRKALDEYELPVLSGTVTQRQIYPQTASDGHTVYEERISNRGQRGRGRGGKAKERRPACSALNPGQRRRKATSRSPLSTRVRI